MVQQAVLLEGVVVGAVEVDIAPRFGRHLRHGGMRMGEVRLAGEELIALIQSPVALPLRSGSIPGTNDSLQLQQLRT